MFIVDRVMSLLAELHEFAGVAGHADGGDRVGYWSPRTATVNWCESDYVYTPYVAEFFNTLSSLPIFLIGLFGVVWGLRSGYRKRFLIPMAIFSFVGIGSMAFHGTLLFVGQAMDELPMIYAAATLLFSVFETKPKIERAWLAPALVIYCLAFTSAYLMSPDLFVYFLLTYIALILCIFFGSLSYYRRIRHKGAKRLLRWAAILYLGGFTFLWMPDKIACYYVQRFQFHALFHITSTIGPWFMITHIIYAFYEIGADDAMPRRSLRAPEGSEPSPTLVYVCGLVPIVALSENVDNKRRS